jgi:hypothetical protein
MHGIPTESTQLHGPHNAIDENMHGAPNAGTRMHRAPNVLTRMHVGNIYSGQLDVLKQYTRSIMQQMKFCKF